MGNKGFFLIETLIVTTIVAVTMVALYTQTTKILDAFEMRTTYNSPNNMYAIAEINKYIIRDARYNSFSTNGAITVNGFYPITCNLFSNLTYCTNLYTDLDIAKVIITQYNTNDIKTKAPTEVTFSEGMKTFISNIKKSTTAPATKYRLIIEFNDQTYSTIELDAGVDTQIPQIFGTASLSYMSTETLDVKEGLTATDNLYNDITDSIVCTNLGGGSYNCVAKDSNGNLSSVLARTVVQVPAISTYAAIGQQNYSVGVSGYYQIELWGGQGATRNAGTNVGGLGAYASGIRYFNLNSIIYFFVGGTGSTTARDGGYNGGGLGGGPTYAITTGGGGGGASDARFGGTALTNRFLVAAGGGGSSGYTAGYPSNGGVGGGTANGGNGTYVTSTYNGSGASVTAGGAVCTFNVLGPPSLGASGVGGNGGYVATNIGAGGGGGGYFGGGGGCDRYGGGGGGSSFASSDVTGVQIIAGNAIMPGKFTGTVTGSAGVGAARITFLSR